MLKHLISLVFLFFSLSYLPALSDTNLKLLPKSKPTISAVKNEKKISVISVSYTHLTLPTIYSV